MIDLIAMSISLSYPSAVTFKYLVDFQKSPFGMNRVAFAFVPLYKRGIEGDYKRLFLSTLLRICHVKKLITIRRTRQEEA
jgi:hypothetical protein